MSDCKRGSLSPNGYGGGRGQGWPVSPLLAAPLGE